MEYCASRYVGLLSCLAVSWWMSPTSPCASPITHDYQLVAIPTRSGALLCGSVREKESDRHFTLLGMSPQFYFHLQVSVVLTTRKWRAFLSQGQSGPLEHASQFCGAVVAVPISALAARPNHRCAFPTSYAQDISRRANNQPLVLGVRTWCGVVD